MKTKLLSRDIVLILAASFFYMSSPMLVTPLISYETVRFARRNVSQFHGGPFLLLL